MILFQHKGDFSKTSMFLKKANNIDFRRLLSKYGQEGVNALALNTPVDSGITANSWSYEIIQNGNSLSIIWKNSNIIDGIPIAIIIQYGHATSNGGYVQGRDYINPAIQPIFDKIAEDAWRGVKSI